MSENAEDLRFYQAIRSRIEHEDGLIVHRLSWLMASQAFLFTAYAIAASGLGGREPAGMELLAELARLLPLVGLVTTGLIYAGIFAALRATAWVRGTFTARGMQEERLGLPPLLTPIAIRRFGLAAPVLLPGVFLLAWAWILFRIA